MIANGGIASSKFGVFLLTGSFNLLAEAIHSSVDSAEQALLFLGAALVEVVNAWEWALHRRFPQIQHLFVEPDEA